MGKVKVLLFSIALLIVVGGCKGYQEEFAFTGTVQEIKAEEDLLVMEEYGSEEQGGRDGNVYEIPAKKIEQYNVGDRLEVTVFSNTVADVWDPDNMKFEIERAGE